MDDEALLELDPERVLGVLMGCAGAGPRYTSYPTAPVWSEDYGAEALADDLSRVPEHAAGHGVSVYVHVPFCRSLCHFCACNRVITRKPELPESYLETLEREVARVREVVGDEVPAAQHHWGGGTPTHLTPGQIRRLHRAVDEAFPALADAEVSVEVDPRVTGEDRLEALRECGFERLSLGVQDFDPRVQEAIHRIQGADETGQLVRRARDLGFGSVSFDLIYGLPFQSVASFDGTLDAVVDLSPERIALYGYAHVTWIARQQRGFERADLPTPIERLRILLHAIRRLLEAGYVYIGMDHFAKPDDALAQALRDGSLRRNFMGYTTREGLELLALGPSGISELAGAYAQSVRDLEPWREAVADGRLATLRGHRLTEEDRARRWVIHRLMCLGEVDGASFAERFAGSFATRFVSELVRLEPLADDGLVELTGDGLRVTPLGRLVVRNVAMVFDAYLPEQQAAARPVFSQTV
jgi:oxygen-independent coproporphyrinogen-3 oxidase